MSNQELLARCQQEGMHTIIQRTYGIWMGHVLRMDTDATTKELLTGGHHKGDDGGQKTTWRRTVEAQLTEINHSWAP